MFIASHPITFISLQSNIYIYIFIVLFFFIIRFYYKLIKLIGQNAESLVKSMFISIMKLLHLLVYPQKVISLCIESY